MDPTAHPDNQDGPSDGAADRGNEDSSLSRTGKVFGGLVGDVRRKAPWYLSDFTDGIHIQCVGSAFFMYVGCLTTMTVFGGLLGAVTNNDIGTFKCLVSGAICGVTYHLFCGQPLTILSSTGPLLLFEGTVYRVCMQFGWYYLEFRFWIGVWICVTFLIFVVFDLSFLMRYITRFTQESFVILIAFIFIYEAFTKQIQQLNRFQSTRALDENCACLLSTEFGDDGDGVTENAFAPVVEDLTTASNWTGESELDCLKRGGHLVGDGCRAQVFPPEFFFSLFLFFGTFFLLLLLKLLKKTRFLPFKICQCISDLAVFGVVCLMVSLDAVVGLRTVKLRIPTAFKAMRSDRGWIINPLGSNPWFSVVAAIPPAVFVAILMFIDQHLATVIITRKEKKLKKGSGFHLDLLVIALQVAVCSAFGAPWFVGATILSINHVHSLTVEAETAPGERPTFLGIREQRVTGILVFTLIGLSVFIAEIFKFVPLSVLYGVLLYMGVASFHGLQFVQRVMAVFKRRNRRPDDAFLRNVPIRRILLFTFIQILCIAALCVVKQIAVVSILFPLMVVATCFVRKALDWVFTYQELLCLDDVLPGSNKKRGENAKKTENADVPELQGMAACNIPEAPNVVGSSEATGFTEDPIPDVMPPAYDVVVHHSERPDGKMQ